MGRTIYVHENSKRILWPGESRPKPRVSGSRGKIIGSRLPFAAHTQELQFTVPKTSIPRTGVWKSKYVKMKLELGGSLKFTMPVVNDVDNSQWQSGTEIKGGPDGGALAAKVEKSIGDHFNAELSAELSDDKIGKIGDSIAKRDWNGVAKQVLSAKLKGKGSQLTKHTSFNWELDISSDNDGCFFGVTGKLVTAIKLDKFLKDVFNVSPAPGQSPPGKGFMAELEFAVTIRFNLTTEGWKAVAQKIGGQAIRTAISAISSNAVRVALGELMISIGVAAVVVVVGVAIPFGALYLCDQARKEGQQQGVMYSYCIGYLARVGVGNNLSSQTKRQLTSDGNRYEVRQLGWSDAEVAIQTSGHRAIQQLTIHHFASTWERKGIFDGGLWDGTPVNIRSRVGKSINNKHEVDGVGLRMAKQIMRQFDEFLEYADRKNVRGLSGTTQ